MRRASHVGLLLLVALSLPACSTMQGAMSSLPGLGGSDPSGPELPEGFGSAASAPASHQEQPLPERVDESIEQVVARGDAHRARGDIAGARFEYGFAHRQDPEAYAPRERLAFVVLGADPGEAEALLAPLVTSHPDEARPHFGLGIARLRLGRADEAIAPLERARELGVDSPQLSAALGRAYDAVGRHVEAQGAYRDARARRPQDFELANDLGVSYSLAGDYRSAEGTLRDALLLNPESAAAHNNLGFALGRLGRYREALREFRAGGSESQALNNLGYVLFLNGEVRQAIGQYERALHVAEGNELTIVQNLRAAQATLAPAGR